MLETEINLYNQNLESLLAESSGKFVLIKNSEIIGIYDNFGDALSNGARLFGLDSYLIRQVMKNEKEINIPALTLGVLNANLSYAILR